MAIQVFLRGGLGNQLFQYAAGLYLARIQNEEPVFRSDLLPLKPDQVSKVSRWPAQISDFNFEGILTFKRHQPPNGTNFFSKALQVERMLGDAIRGTGKTFGFLAGDKITNDEFSAIPRIRLVNSYCVSSIPAKRLGEELRGQIMSVREPSPGFLDLLGECREVGPIVVHIRLGDYQELPQIFGKPDYEKLEKVLTAIARRTTAPVWLFSDSPEEIEPEVLEKMKVQRIVGPNELIRPLESLIVMASGSHLVCANSTFSWWAAFLKGPNGAVHFPKRNNSSGGVFTNEMILWDWSPY